MFLATLPPQLASAHDSSAARHICSVCRSDFEVLADFPVVSANTSPPAALRPIDLVQNEQK